MIKIRPVPKSYANGTEIGRQLGPIKGRNWHYTTGHNPEYNIVTNGGTGEVKLQGTNDKVLRNGEGWPNPFTKDFLPSEGASWTDIATTTTSTSGTFNTEYMFLRLIISSSGTGDVTEAWVRWS